MKHEAASCKVCPHAQHRKQLKCHTFPDISRYDLSNIGVPHPAQKNAPCIRNKYDVI